MILTIDHLMFSRGKQLVLDDVSLQIDSAGLYGLIGPNGGGKSTLLKVICGLLQPSAGRIAVLGGQPQQMSPKLALVPQAADFDRAFPVTLRGLVETALLGPGLFDKPDPSVTDMTERVERAMEQAGIAALANRRLSALSGGELQRALIARALAVNPAFLLLDEPTASVDQKHANRLFELLCDLGQDIPVLVVSHDLAHVAAHCNRVFCVNQQLWEAQQHASAGELAEQIFTQTVHCGRTEEAA